MGTFTAFGIASAPFEFDMANSVVFKGAHIIGISGRKMFETWYQVSNLLSNGLVDLNPVITHQFDFKDFMKAIDMAVGGNEPSSKIVLNM